VTADAVSAGTPAASPVGPPVRLPRQRSYRPADPLDLDATLLPHRRGRYDPCQRVDDHGGHWRTWRTPDGPVTLRLERDARAGEVRAQAWGAGAQWAIDALPRLLGADDDWTGLVLDHPVLRETRRRAPGMRLGGSGLVFEALVPAIIEQLVTGTEARRAWVSLVATYGEPAPGPNPLQMKVFPGADVLRGIADWHWHRIGLDGRRRRTVIAAAHVAHRIDECAYLDVETSARRLRSIPGIGPWTVAETLQRSHGAPDLVSVGDYHVPNAVGFVLAGRARTDDATMLDLLEPYRGHRQRVVRLVEASGMRAPRYGPRMAPRDNRGI
jgi:3-methyladenine DNA glycosylase/8-oxoguanine DNA glycosylase